MIALLQGRARQGSVEYNSCREGYIQREHCSFEFLLEVMIKHAEREAELESSCDIRLCLSCV